MDVIFYVIFMSFLCHFCVIFETLSFRRNPCERRYFWLLARPTGWATVGSLPPWWWPIPSRGRDGSRGGYQLDGSVPPRRRHWTSSAKEKLQRDRKLRTPSQDGGRVGSYRFLGDGVLDADGVVRDFAVRGRRTSPHDQQRCAAQTQHFHVLRNSSNCNGIHLI